MSSNEPIPSSANPAPAAAPAAAPPPSDPSGRPEFIPEKFWDPVAKAPKVEDLAKSYAGLESKFGKGKDAYEAERLGKRPEAADKYELAVEGFSPEFLAQHPLTPVVRELAYENGLDQEGFKGLTAKIVGALAAAAPKPEEELAKLGDNAAARIQALENAITTTIADPAEREALALVATTAAGVKALERVMALAKGQPVGELPKGDAPSVSTRKSRQDIDKMMQDPRYWHPRQRDESFVKEVTDWFQSGAGA